jgi:hypothetical protein
MQVRCVVAVLLLVGKGLEKPSIVRDLLDLELTKSVLSSLPSAADSLPPSYGWWTMFSAVCSLSLAPLFFFLLCFL